MLYSFVFLVLCYISSLEAQLSSYGGGGSSGAGGRGSGGAGGSVSGSGGSGGGGSLEESIPGVPGEDYPIYATVPDTGFSCDGQVRPDILGDVMLMQGVTSGRGWQVCRPWCRVSGVSLLCSWRCGGWLDNLQLSLS